VKNTLPKQYSSDVLTLGQFGFLVSKLPQPKAATGRPSYSNQILLPGILKVLRSGCRWRDLDLADFPSGVTHWRRLKFWQEKACLWPIWKLLLRLLANLDMVNLDAVKIDGTLVSSYQFRNCTGYSGRHNRTGVKVSAAVDTDGLPLAVKLAPGNVADVDLATPTLERIRIGNKTRPGIVLADKGYDSTRLRRSLRKRGIKANIPERGYGHRRKIGRPPNYDPVLGKSRYSVERTNAWMKSFRRIHFRYDRTLPMFRSWVQLACIVICLRRLLP
jgi:transposase